MNRLHLDRIAEIVREAEALRASFFGSCAEDLARTADALAACLAAGGKLLLFGNGGSAADAQHIASEFVNKLGRKRRALAALALTTDASAVTSIANDSSFDQIFARQIEALGKPGDVALGISTSGSSPNVLEGLRMARELGLVTVGLLGRDGGKALALCRYPIVVPHHDTQRVQEIHSMVGHVLAELTELGVLGQPERA